jgi:hypothetical protein
MIVDCFRFFNELDVLELRLRTLDAVVDRFVISEAPFTFRGDPKALYFSENAERFAAWCDRITVVVYPGPPVDNAWTTADRQREHLSTALVDCAPDDLILIGDCDEIPDPRLVTHRPQPGRILAHRMVMMKAYANRAVDGGANVWIGTRAVPAASIAGFGGQVAIRRAPLDVLDVVDGGWHFTSLGGTIVQELKLRSFEHSEFDIPYFNDRRRLDVHYDTADGPDAAHEVPAADLPAPLRDDPRWAKYLWNRTAAVDGVRGAALEHAHGCLAYVAADAASVVVLSTQPGMWDDAGRARFGAAFAGVFRDPDALAQTRAEWCIVDGLEHFAAGTLAHVRACSPHAVVFGTNARSIATFSAALNGRTLHPGRALGRAECEAESATAGYAVRTSDRIPTQMVPWTVPPAAMEMLYQLEIGRFRFAELALDALHDFESNALVFTLDAQR